MSSASTVSLIVVSFCGFHCHFRVRHKCDFWRNKMYQEKSKTKFHFYLKQRRFFNSLLQNWHLLPVFTWTDSTWSIILPKTMASQTLHFHLLPSDRSAWTSWTCLIVSWRDSHFNEQIGQSFLADGPSPAPEMQTCSSKAWRFLYWPSHFLQWKWFVAGSALMPSSKPAGWAFFMWVLTR